MKKSRLLVFSILALFLSWRIVVVNVSQYLAAADDAAALQWKRDTPSALMLKAADVVQSDPKLARNLALESSFYNPANGHAFLMLAMLWESEGKLTFASKAAAMADFLAPRDADVQLKLGSFWAQRGQPKEILSHWASALETRPALGEALFPVMLEIVDTPLMREKSLLALGDSPSWWGKFFKYALKNSAHEETLKALYNAKIKTIEQDERRAYLDHLINAGLYTDAYFIWLNSLNSSQITTLGNVNDGSFEQEITDEGFGWRSSKSNAFKLAAESTYGSVGEKALHLAFQNKVSSHPVISQFLMLDPGRYHLRGQVRVDNLVAGKGLRWSVVCAGVVNEQLTNSEYFIGSTDWTSFESSMEVPAKKCELQQLVLRTDSAMDYDATAYSGSIWFDNIEVVRIDE